MSKKGAVDPLQTSTMRGDGSGDAGSQGEGQKAGEVSASLGGLDVADSQHAEGFAVGTNGDKTEDTTGARGDEISLKLGPDESQEDANGSGIERDNEPARGVADEQGPASDQELAGEQNTESGAAQGADESTRGEIEESDLTSEAAVPDVSVSEVDAEVSEDVVKRRPSTEPFDQDGAVSFSEEVASVSVSIAESGDASPAHVSRETAGVEGADAPDPSPVGDVAASVDESADVDGMEDSRQQDRSDADARLGSNADAIPAGESGLEQAEPQRAAAVPGGEDDQPLSDAATGSEPMSESVSSGAAESHAVGPESDSEPSAGSRGAEDQDSEDEGLVEVPGATFAELPLDYIIPNTRQPRNVFDEEELSELAASIREVGVLQPVIVRPLDAPVPDNPQARYELIMGERRWRASVLAGEETVPAIVRRTQDEDLLRDALLENLHRTQLNALEEAAAYQQLLEDFQCTQEELSRRIARSRPQISNTLRLLKLPPLVQRRVAAGVLSAGHARALLGLSDPGAMERIAQKIVAEGLSVRQVEELVALGDETAAPVPTRRRAKRYAPELGELATRLTDRFDTRVKVEMGARRGSIKIDFASIDDLNRILGVLTPGEEGVDVDE